MHIRLSRVLSCIVVAATLVAFAPSAHAQSGPASGAGKGNGKGKGADASKAAAPTSASTPTPAHEASTLPAEDADKEDPRAVYFSADLGFTRPDVGGISDNLAFDKTKANGVLGGLGVGYRLKALRLGARFRDASTTEFSLWSFMGELGFDLPFRPLTPVVFLHAGYMFDAGIQRAVVVSSLPAGNILTPNIDLRGLVLGWEAYLGYTVTKGVKFGPFLGLDLTFLHRAQPKPPQSLFPLTDETRNNALFGDSGSGVGYMMSLGVRVMADAGL